MPLLGHVQQLASDGGRLGIWRLLTVLHRLEPPGDVLDGELLEIEERLDRINDLRVPLRHAAEELLHRVLLRQVGVAIACHLLHQIGQPHGEVLDLFPGLKGEVPTLLGSTAVLPGVRNLLQRALWRLCPMLASP
jgi:hypothetical protein